MTPRKPAPKAVKPATKATVPPEPIPEPEDTYAPPAPARTGETVAPAGDCVMVSYYEEGQRYAAIGATEADARKLLADDPQFCLNRF